MNFEMKNLLKPSKAIKIVELVFVLATMLVHAMDDTAKITGGLSNTYFAVMTYYGFFFIVQVQIVGIVATDKSPMQDLLFATCGFFFYLSEGSKIASIAVVAGQKGLASISIITSFVFLADLVLGVFELKKSA